MDPAEQAMLRIELVWSPRPGCVLAEPLMLAAGSTVSQALAASPRFALDRAGLEAGGPLCVGVWGRQQALETVLRDHDRVEVYRPLTVDPKEARRLRYRATGRRIVSRHRPLGGRSGA
ncbi:RnfH family protein [Mitsuaria sp. WAJ17]|uniref:RnfH family protein n=1 Tax=Mitsuaria sp. WAJ17 TaxID=2761452 RepID=UPI0021076F7E|nr:RnfH family protein [Mitsuaria sp. WAJ17]